LKEDTIISLLEKHILKTVIAEYLEEIELGNITDRDFIEFIVDYIETIANEKAIQLLNELTAKPNEDRTN
jgi:hypothetical protein|tara:strand:+ start:125 stop:334 length:210 start_codon:yes stop_codon:yes gene_type:complete